MKECGKCKIHKEIVSFGNNRNRPDGLQDWCKACFKDLRIKNKAKKAAYDREYYSTHRDEIISNATRYYLNNTDKVKDNVKRWAELNRDRSNANHLEKNRKRRARKLNQLGYLPDGYWLGLLENCGQKCMNPECLLEINQLNPLTLDHIIPIVNGGLHDIDNLQVLCKSCNSSKGSKTVDYRPI